ncbi:MAG: GntR family transcriptional regulator [Eubacteriaceae bacterium]|nr:GntR family transcriptional regulator [Eubacteriaceae bacterium]
MNKEQINAVLSHNPFEQLSDIVFNLIKQDITSSILKPGEKLNISKISEELNISRTPVREALIKLYESGLVNKDPDKQGFYVSVLNTEDIRKIYFLRTAIESKAAFLCASQKTCPNIDTLKTLAENISKPFSFDKLSSIDTQFHNLIVYSCGNNFLIEIYNFMENKFNRVRVSNLMNVIENDMEALQKTSAEHFAVINSISANMPELAEKEMINHITNAYKDTFLYSNAEF